MKKLYIAITIIIYLISNWIMDVTTWIHSGVKACGILFCITNNNADLIYHITWYTSIVITLTMALMLLQKSDKK